MKHSFIAAAALAGSASAFGNSSFSGPQNSTCKCKPFVIDLTWGSGPSNLFGRDVILTNGSLPAPPLKLTVGDCVDFTVNNNMGFATGVHFHGIRQLETPWSDGTPGLTQYAIQSGDSYTYTWTADEPGTYFYHSHYKSQMMDGLYGAIVINPVDNSATPFASIDSDVTALGKAAANLETIFTSDWNQVTSSDFFAIEAASNVDWACADSIILNGMGGSYCLDAATIAANQRPQVPQILGAFNETLTAKGCIPAANPLIQGTTYTRDLSALPPTAYDQCTSVGGKNYTYEVDASDKWAAMSFISPAGYALFVATIDNHKMYVYELNGAYITPQIVDQVEVNPGDRVSFFVKLDQTPGDYTIRIANSGINQVISGYGTLSYKGGSGPQGTAIMNIGGVSPANQTVALLDTAGAAPLGAPAVGQSADRTFVLDIMKNPTDNESYSWVLDGINSYSQANDDQTPFLYETPSNIPDSDLVLRTNYNEWVDLIIKIAGPIAQPHPIHKHANKFYVIGAGTGSFNFSSVAAAASAGFFTPNLANPPYLDGYTSTPSEGADAWMVFRYQANTPGAWFMHCHIQSHFTGGMAVAILDAVDQWPTVPSTAGQACLAGGHNGTSNGTSPINGGHGSGNGTSGGGNGGSGTTTSGSGTTTTSGSGPTGTAGGQGQWGDWTATVSGKATVSAKGGSAGVTGKPAGNNGYDGAAWTAWQSISSAAAASAAAHTVLAGSGKDGSQAGYVGSWSGSSGSGSGSGKGSDASSSSSSWAAWDGSSSSTKGSAASTTFSTASGSWSAWNGASSSTSSKPVDASSTSTGSWYGWDGSSSSTPVAATSTATGSWTIWGSAATSTPVAATSASSSWAAWSSGVATPAAATTGIASYNGTGSAGIATYYGAAPAIKAGGVVVFGVFAGVLAMIM